MEIINAVGHLLSKERQGVSTPSFRKNTWEIDVEVTKLALSVRDLYSKKSTKHWGLFEENAVSYPFQTLLENHLDGQINFVEFTRDAVNHLKARIDEKPLATGGYVVFVHYQSQGDEFLQVVMLNDTAGSAFDNEMNVLNTTHLDLEKLHLGGRINVTRWRGDQDTYLSFVKGRNAEVSGYFRLFLGCTDYTPAKESSNRLVKATRAYCHDKNFTKDEKRDFERNVYSFVEEKRKSGKVITLDALSRFVDPENPDDFFIFANTDDWQVDNIISPDRNTIKKLQYVTYDGKEVKLTFPSRMVGNGIEYDREQGTLTFEEIPQDLKDQLEEISDGE